MSMLLSASLVLVPVLFVLALGYWAGRAKQFDFDQVQGLNTLVLEYALPASLFVGVVTTPRSALLATGPFVVALLIASVGLFVVAIVLSVATLKHRVGEAAMQAFCVSSPNVVFIGLPILTPVFGPSSILTVAVASLVWNVTVTPLTITILESCQRRSAGGETRRLPVLVGESLASSLRKPIVTAPLLATVLVLLAVSVPKELVSMLNLIGSATTGVAVFMTGLIIAAYHIKVTLETAGNALVKMLVQPALMAGLVAALGISKPLGSEAILICALPTAIVPAMVALQYHVYEAATATTVLLTTLLMIVVVPAAIALVRA